MVTRSSVLVVDDDKDFLRIVQKVLETGGFSVVTTTDAMGAMEQLQREVFDLVLSDANMPGPSGFDLVKTIRKTPGLASLTVALLTGRRDKEDVDRGMKSGADDYIVKPIDPDVFLDKIQTLLKNRPPQEMVEISFAESPVHLEANWKVKTEITTISERGLTLWSPITAPLNAKFKVSSDLFTQIQIDPPLLRVVNCTPDPRIPNLYFTQVSFVGLNEGERQKIRFWINTNITFLKDSKRMAA